MIFPQLNLNINNVINQSRQETQGAIPKEYAWDFENNKFLLQDGKFIIVEDLDALKIWIWKALYTTKMRYCIYSEEYGNELEFLIGKEFSRELMEIETKRMVWECLRENKHIKSIENFNLNFIKDMLEISFDANTDIGLITINKISV